MVNTAPWLMIEQLTSEKKEIESRIETSLELLVDGRVPKERVIIKMQQDEQKLRDLQDKIIKVEEIKAPTAEDLEVFRNRLRSKVEGELDMDTKKSVLNSIVKKMGVNQGGLVEIDFCVALGNTPYEVCRLVGVKSLSPMGPFKFPPNSKVNFHLPIRVGLNPFSQCMYS